MSFSKVKKQTLPEMVDNFWMHMNECKSEIKKNGSISNLKQKMNILDFQISLIEKALNNAPDDKKIQYSYLYQNAHSEYIRFKQNHIYEIEASKNNQNVPKTEESNQQLIEQSIIEQETENLEYLANEIQIITQQMKEINEISNCVYNELQSQRPRIVKIDTLISESVNHMEQGNKQLEKAEKNQKKCNIC